MLHCGTAEGSGKDRIFSPFFNFDLSKLFPGFDKMTEAQQMTIEYGVKQKCSDSCARPKDQKLSRSEIIAQLEETRELILSGEWVKKVAPKTPLEKAIASKEATQKLMAEMIKAAIATGIEKGKAESLAKKLFGPQLTELSKKIEELKKEEK